MPIAQFSGLASGIDSGALIDAVIEAREVRNDIRRADIEHLESENDALEELNTKLLALDDLIDAFRTVNGGGVGKSATSTDPTVATASATSAANNAAYSLSVNTVADTATGSFNNSYSSSTAYVSTAGSGTVTVTVGQGADQIVINSTVTVNSTTLQDLVNDINDDASADGRVVASVVNIGTDASPDYRLLFTTLETGESEGNLALSASAAITELQTTTIDQATNAVFSISGISDSVTRESNTISDVISGLTFQLYDTGSTDITVGNDSDSTADEINEIVEAFNDIVDYVNENDTVERIEEDEQVSNVFGTLAKTRIDNDFLDAFRSALSSASSSSQGAVSSMAELGLATQRDGTITFDTDAFKEAITDDPSGATDVLRDFADQISGVSGIIYQYTKLNGFIDSAQEGNDDEIENLQDAIEQLERQTASLRETMEMQFARLEQITGEMQSQQQALSGILAGLQS